MKKYTANWSIQGLGKKTIAPGQTITLDEKTAEPLVACGALTEVEDAAPQAPAK